VEEEPIGGCAEPKRESAMIVFIIQMLLFCGLALLTYVIWTYIAKDGPRHDRYHATQTRGDRPMTDTVVGTERE
jgi:hypothetical protein